MDRGCQLSRCDRKTGKTVECVGCELWFHVRSCFQAHFGSVCTCGAEIDDDSFFCRPCSRHFCSMSCLRGHEEQYHQTTLAQAPASEVRLSEAILLASVEEIRQETGSNWALDHCKSGFRTFLAKLRRERDERVQRQGEKAVETPSEGYADLENVELVVGGMFGDIDAIEEQLRTLGVVLAAREGSGIFVTRVRPHFFVAFFQPDRGSFCAIKLADARGVSVVSAAALRVLHELVHGAPVVFCLNERSATGLRLNLFELENTNRVDDRKFARLIEKLGTRRSAPKLHDTETSLIDTSIECEDSTMMLVSGDRVGIVTRGAHQISGRQKIGVFSLEDVASSESRWRLPNSCPNLFNSHFRMQEPFPKELDNDELKFARRIKKKFKKNRLASNEFPLTEYFLEFTWHNYHLCCHKVTWLRGVYTITLQNEKTESTENPRQFTFELPNNEECDAVYSIVDGNKLKFVVVSSRAILRVFLAEFHPFCSRLVQLFHRPIAQQGSISVITSAFLPAKKILAFAVQKAKEYFVLFQGVSDGPLTQYSLKTKPESIFFVWLPSASTGRSPEHLAIIPANEWHDDIEVVHHLQLSNALSECSFVFRTSWPFGSFVLGTSADGTYVFVLIESESDGSRKMVAVDVLHGSSECNAEETESLVTSFVLPPSTAESRRVLNFSSTQGDPELCVVSDSTSLEHAEKEHTVTLFRAELRNRKAVLHSSKVSVETTRLLRDLLSEDASIDAASSCSNGVAILSTLRHVLHKFSMEPSVTRYSTGYSCRRNFHICLHLAGTDEFQEKRSIVEEVFRRNGVRLESVVQMLSGRSPRIWSNPSMTWNQSAQRLMHTLTWLIPIKIAEFQSGRLKLCESASADVSTPDATLSPETSVSFDFGVYSDFFHDFAEWKVIPLCAIGKESDGKSFMLNQLIGTVFEVSGARQTDGVWMAARPSYSDKKLYLALDFEGLCSLQRHEEEDIALMQIAVAIGGAFLFRLKSYDKGTQALLSRLEATAQKLDGLDERKDSSAIYGNLFQGLPYLVFRDLAGESFQQLLREKKNCLLGDSVPAVCKLFLGGVKFFAGPQLEEVPATMSDLFQQIQADVPAKLSTHDVRELLPLLIQTSEGGFFSTLDDRIVQARANSMRAGPTDIIVKGEPAELVRFFELPAGVENKKVRKCLRVLDGSRTLQDKFGVVSTETLVTEFIKDNSREAATHAAWFDSFKRHCSKVYLMRKSIAQVWIDSLRHGVQTETPTLARIREEVKRTLIDLDKLIVPCGEECEKCFVECVRGIHHDGKHSCRADELEQSDRPHLCSFQCEYCDSKCRSKAGHQFKAHLCEQQHTCEKECPGANSYGTCSKTCKKSAAHGGEHSCNSVHECGEPCSRVGCSSKCRLQLPSDEPHRHECGGACLQMCTLCPQSLDRRCTCADHFHDKPYICDEKHQCQKKCAQKGACNITQKTETQWMQFSGATEFVPIEIKPPLVCVHNGVCDRQFPRGEGEHDESCKCRGAKHLCGEPCPLCGCGCTKEFGHAGRHSTEHGHVRNAMYVSSSMSELSSGNVTLKSGSSLVALTCAGACRALKRGHVHEIPCRCSGVNEVNPSPAGHPRWQHVDGTDNDMLSHADYWNLIGWKQPADHTDFDKCGVSCRWCDHLVAADRSKNMGYSQTFCTESPSLHGGKHSLPCKHHFFFVFVVDTSRSVSCALDDNSTNKKSRIQAIKESMLSCLDTIERHFSENASVCIIQLACQVSVDDVLSGAPEDFRRSWNSNRSDPEVMKRYWVYVDAIAQNTDAKIVVPTQRNIASVREQFQRWMSSLRPAGATFFCQAIRSVTKVIGDFPSPQNTSTTPQKLQPIVVFLSDGEDHSVAKQSRRKAIAQVKSSFPHCIFHTIGVGNERQFKTLREMSMAFNSAGKVQSELAVAQSSGFLTSALLRVVENTAAATFRQTRNSSHTAEQLTAVLTHREVELLQSSFPGICRAAGGRIAPDLFDKLVDDRGMFALSSARRLRNLRVLHALQPDVFVSLRSLDLGGNRISAIPAGLFGPVLQQLKELKLNRNSLTCIDGSCFGELQLELLDVSHNRLVVVDPGTLKYSAGSLKCADFSSNLLLSKLMMTQLTEQSKLSAGVVKFENCLSSGRLLDFVTKSSPFDLVSTMDLQRTALGVMFVRPPSSPTIFNFDAVNDANLAAVVFENVRLTNIHDPKSSMTSLHTLIIRGAGLSNKLWKTLDAPSLTHLDLSNNGLTSEALKAAPLSKLPLLQHVVLSDNAIGHFDPGLFDAQRWLVELDVSSNNLSQFSADLSHCLFLEHVDLSHNFLSRPPVTSLLPKSVRRLYLSCNLISHVDVNHEFPNELRWLDMSFNGLSSKLFLPKNCSADLRGNPLADQESPYLSTKDGCIFEESPSLEDLDGHPLATELLFSHQPFCKALREIVLPVATQVRNCAENVSYPDDTALRRVQDALKLVRLLEKQSIETQPMQEDESTASLLLERLERDIATRGGGSKFVDRLGSITTLGKDGTPSAFDDQLPRIKAALWSGAVPGDPTWRSFRRVAPKLFKLLDREVRHRIDHCPLGDLPRTFVLYGPPGCVKTKAVEALSTFANVPLLLYNQALLSGGNVGDSEMRIQAAFLFARRLAPCFVLFDEGESFFSKPKTTVAANCISIVKVELEKLINEQAKVFVFCATNNPFDIDAAVANRVKMFHAQLPSTNQIAGLIKSYLLMKRFEFGALKDRHFKRIAEQLTPPRGLVFNARVVRTLVRIAKENAGNEPLEYSHFRFAISKVGSEGTVEASMVQKYDEFERAGHQQPTEVDDSDGD